MFSKELYCKFRYLLSKKRNFIEICRELDMKDTEVMLLIDSLDDSSIYTKLFGEGYSRLKRPQVTEEPYQINPNKEHLTIALLGDTHLCHKDDAIDVIREGYYIIEKRKTDFVLHCGDLFDGINPNFPDYRRTLKKDTYEEQLEYGISNYPSYSNKTLVVSGNHDDYWYDLVNKEILKDLSLKRDDIVYLGANRRKIMMNGLVIDLVHGDLLKDGSYGFKIGRYLRELDESDRPNIIHYGHKHSSSFNLINGIYCYKTPALMYASPYHRSKGYGNNIGMYFLDVYFDDDGKVKKIKHKKESLDK